MTTKVEPTVERELKFRAFSESYNKWVYFGLRDIEGAGYGEKGTVIYIKQPLEKDNIAIDPRKVEIVNKVKPTVEKWEDIDGLIKEVDSQLVRTPAGNVSVIDEMIPCDVMDRVKYFLYKAYDLGKAHSVQEAKAELAEYCVHQTGCPLAYWEAGRPTKDGGYETKWSGKWYKEPDRPKCTCGLNDLLASLKQDQLP